MYTHDVPEALHVGDFNDQSGAQTKTVTVPTTASAIAVRFDCVGAGEKFRVAISGMGSGGYDCDSISDHGWSSGGIDAKGEPFVRKGDKITLKVAVADGVRWSLSVDLAQDEKVFDRLTLGDS